MVEDNRDNRIAACLNALGERGVSVNRELIKTLVFFDAAQVAGGVCGHIAEIGVAQGAFFAPLAACCRKGEMAIAVDVFDDGPNWNPSGGTSSLGRFKKTIGAAIGNGVNVDYLSTDSFQLTSNDLLSASGGGFRLFSIDGAHSVHHTIHDLTIAGETLAPGGIVWLDDIRNWGWPGVIDGFARYMLLSPSTRLVPFFLYSNKLLLTMPAQQELYLAKAIELAEIYGRKPEVSYRVSSFFGHRVVGWN